MRSLRHLPLRLRRKNARYYPEINSIVNRFFKISFIFRPRDVHTGYRLSDDFLNKPAKNPSEPTVDGKSLKCLS